MKNISVWPGDEDYGDKQICLAGDKKMFGQTMMVMVINRPVWPGDDGSGDKQICLARQ